MGQQHGARDQEPDNGACGKAPQEPHHGGGPWGKGPRAAPWGPTMGQGVNGRTMGWEAVSFHALFSRLSRRIDTLARLYGTGPLPVDLLELGAQARAYAGFASIALDTVGRRYSARQGRTHPLSGLEGHFHLDGEGLASFWPFLFMGQYVQVGKSTVQGLGAYTVSDGHRR